MKKLLSVLAFVFASSAAFAGNAWNSNTGVNSHYCAVGSPGAWTLVVQATITKQLAASTSVIVVDTGGFTRYVKAFPTGSYRLGIFRDGTSIWTSADPTANGFELILDDLQGKPDIFHVKFQDAGSYTLTGQHTYALKVQMLIDSQCISWDHSYIFLEELNYNTDRKP